MTRHRDVSRRPGRLLRWLVAGPAAVAAIVAILAGGPLALLTLGGNPLPRTLAVDELFDLLTAPDDGRLLIWALTVVGWLAWAAVASSLLLELGAQLTGRGTPRVPGLAGPQRLASLLVAAALTALTSPGVGHAHAAYLDTAVHAGYLDPAVGTGEDAAAGYGYDRSEAAPVVHTVQRGEGLVDVAERYQVSVERLAIANHHRPQPDGLALRPGELRIYPGWQLRIPESDRAAELLVPASRQAAPERLTTQSEAQPESLVHEVAKGDWMWHIAGRYLGDELRYPEIAALNPGYADKYADYPDHIQPGDQLMLPDGAYDRGERRHAAGELVGEAPGEPPEAAPAPAEPAPAEPAPPEPAEPEPATPSPAPEPSPSPSLAPSPSPVPAPAPAPAPAPSPSTPESSPTRTASPPPPVEAAPLPPPPGGPVEEVPPGPDPGDTAPGDPAAGEDPGDAGIGVGPLVTAGVLASVLVGAVALYRGRKMAHRRHRRTVTSEAGAPTEAGLRAAATADVGRLDHALRLLSADPDGPGAPPDVGAVWIADGDIHLILAGQELREPPRPFHIGGRGSWVLPAEAELPEVAGGMAPLPTLVTIGSQPGEHLLVDLERIGMLTVSGPPERTSDLLRYLVAELAHNPWSDLVEVTIVGFPGHESRLLASLNPDRIRVATSLPVAADALRRRLDHTSGVLDTHGLPDALHGRIRDTATDTWSPQLLVVNQPDPDDDELLSYLEATFAHVGRRCAVAVVTTAHPEAPYGRRSVTITEDGLLTAAFLDESHYVRAVGLPARLLGPLTELVQDATAPVDHPIPPAPEPWAAGTDATGGRTAAPTTYGFDAGTSADALGGDTPEQAFPVIATPLPQTPSPVQPPAPPAPAAPAAPVQPAPPVAPAAPAEPVPPYHRANGGYDDAGLDDAVAGWWRGAIQPPRVAVLGPIEVTAPGQSPSHRARVCQELVAFLAARGDEGADATEITERLWPHQNLPATVRTAVIMSVRRWLGTGQDGEQWLSEAVPDGRYRLRHGILVDWHLFRRLRTRAEHHGRSGAGDLRAALRLVRGAPLQDAGQMAGTGLRVPYSWLPASSFAPDLIVAGVVDSAHQLVDLSLAAGDRETARWAVHQAWLADPRRSDDHPWRDLMRIAHAEGDPDRVREVLSEMLRWRDAEHPDELAPATQELVSSLLVRSDG